MRAVFFGTPAIAVPALRALGEIAEIAGVVCQPDRPSGRGLALGVPAVKAAALETGLEVYQPEKVRTGELTQWLRERAPDFALVMAYGRILPEDVLAAPRLGSVNLHASLLPAYRGAAPIQWSIARGETRTGVSLMQMDVGLDTGPVYATLELPIGPDETSGELAPRIAALAAELTLAALPRFARGELSAVPQDAAHATHAPPIEPEHTTIDFRKSAREIHNWVRALMPKPGARSLLRGKTLKILATRLDSDGPTLTPCEVAVQRPDRVWVGTGEGNVTILRAQLEGRRAVEASDIVNGRLLAMGDSLGQ